jgi:hypothetical protein
MEENMTTQQLDRPLSQVDDAAEWVQASTPDEWSRSTEEPPTAMRAKEAIRCIAQDRVALLTASLAATALVIVIIAFWSRRRPPQSVEDVLLDRSREALDRASETLEAMASRLAWIDR